MVATLEGMADVATLLDEWCELCGEKLASIESADGVKACDYCAKEVLKALAKYQADADEVAAMRRRRGGPSAGQAKARAKRRAKRKRTKR